MSSLRSLKPGLTEDFFEDAISPFFPSHKQKASIERLRCTAFDTIREFEIRPLLEQIAGLTRHVVLRDLSEDKDALLLPTHALFWKRLGCSSENPLAEFSVYEEPPREPLHAGVTSSPVAEIKKSSETNAFVQRPPSPTSCRFRGGILSVQCLLFFLTDDRYSRGARGVIERRWRKSEVNMESTDYSIIHVSFEICRELALHFSIITTSPSKRSWVPVQPDGNVQPPFPVDKRANKSDPNLYKLKSYWNYISEVDAFERLFSLFFLSFEVIFNAREAIFCDSHLAISEASEFLLTAMNKTKSLKELETILLDEVGLLPPLEEVEDEKAAAAATAAEEDV